ncbi:MAG: hypothetical protein HFI30_04930 [Lachnospiraceae bacterium]|jgi:hypothetical protein|nr:hypothetical protein [Lachnospiraceae bacterium]
MKDYNFQKLTPINNIEDLGAYTYALDFVFKHDDLRNIAVTGPYGAGKSSMIETYKLKSRYRFLHISLAHFEETEKEARQDAHREEDLRTEKSLEGKILNQLLHQIDPQDIEQTNFKVKKQISQEEVTKSAECITLFFLLFLYLTRFGAWQELLLAWPDSFLRDILLATLSPYAVIAAGCVFAGLFLFGIRRVIRLQKARNIFKKLQFEGNELELFEENKESYFDRYLNEVLYLFENVHGDVIVFEDMDRFEMVRIFERLREINRLVNERRGREKKPVIRFFYLLRDDIFTSKDRTKFFDYIIPVIPVLDGSNAKEKFLKFFHEAGIIRDFDPVFLRDVFLYIDEMRTLKNIYNEYRIYSEKINFIGLDPNKLLAMVIYKNIFPKDFHDLHLRQGYVNRVFENREAYIERAKREKTERLRERREEVEKEIQRMSEEKLKSLDELDALFFNFTQGRIRIGEKEKSTYKSNVQVLHDMKENPGKIEYYFKDYYHSGSWRIYPFKEEYDKLSQNLVYVARKKRLEERDLGKTEILKKQLADMEEEINNLELRKIRNLVSRRQLEEITYTDPTGREETYDSVKASPYFRLLQYLLLNGWIDEAYTDYMSYFYEGSINRQEKEFLLSIADGKAKPYTFELKPSSDGKPSLELLNELHIRDFSKKEILNFSLLKLLMDNREGYRDFYEAFFKLLRDTKNLKFIIGFYQCTKDPKCFLQDLNTFWPEVVKEILEEESISFADKKAYVLDTILICGEKEAEEEEVWVSSLEDLDVDGCIAEYISAHEDFIRIPDTDMDVEVIFWGYQELQVEFETWLYEEPCSKMSFNIYKKDMYMLSRKNIEAVCKTYILVKGEEWTWENAATQILLREEEPICSYVKENMEIFVDILLKNVKGVIVDLEKIALEILNHKSVSEEKKKKYIALMEKSVTRLSDIQGVSLWDELLKYKAVAYTEQNILDYYFKGEEQWSEPLIAFINSSLVKLNFGFLRRDQSYGEKAGLTLWNSVIDCMELSNEKYEEILCSMWFCYEDFSKQDIDADKMEILIRRQIIHMTEKNLKFMRKNYPAQIIYFVKINMAKYLELLTDELFSMDELLSLLEDGDVTVNTKRKLLDKTREKISVAGKKYTPAVKQKILAEHLDVEDLEFLLREYRKERDGKTRELMRSLAVSHIQEILERGYRVDPLLLRRLLGEGALEMEERQLLLSQNISDYSKEETISLLKQAGLTQILPVFEGKNPRIEKSEVVDNLLPVFQEKGWIGKVKEETDESTFYRLFSRGSNK